MVCSIKVNGPAPGVQAMLRPSLREVKIDSCGDGRLGRPPGAAWLLPKGVTPSSPSSYNDSVMSTVSDAAQESQFASARVLAALPGVSAPLSGQSPIAPASQPLR